MRSIQATSSWLAYVEAEREAIQALRQAITFAPSGAQQGLLNEVEQRDRQVQVVWDWLVGNDVREVLQ